MNYVTKGYVYFKCYFTINEVKTVEGGAEILNLIIIFIEILLIFSAQNFLTIKQYYIGKVIPENVPVKWKQLPMLLLQVLREHQPPNLLNQNNL